MDIFKEIKERLTMKEVVERYGITVNRSGFCLCPFHHEKTPSMKVYEKTFKCYGCGEGGDVINFVQLFFKVSPLDACKKLNSDFSLGMELNGRIEPVIKNEQVMMQERRQILRDKENCALGIVSDYLRLLNRYSVEHKPRNFDEVPDKQFIEFLTEYTYAEYLYEELMNAKDFQFKEKEKFYFDIEESITGILEKYSLSQNNRRELIDKDDKFSKDNIIGNASYTDIKDKVYIKYINSTAVKITDELKRKNIPFTAIKYSRITEFAVDKKDIPTVRDIAEQVSGKYSRMRKSKEQSKPVVQQDEREV